MCNMYLSLEISFCTLKYSIKKITALAMINYMPTVLNILEIQAPLKNVSTFINSHVCKGALVS